jgi:hypothetical protein
VQPDLQPLPLREQLQARERVDGAEIRGERARVAGDACIRTLRGHLRIRRPGHAKLIGSAGIAMAADEFSNESASTLRTVRAERKP